MLARRMVSSVVQRQVKYVEPVEPGSARDGVATVYEQAADEFRLVVPPVLLHSPSPPVLAAYWTLMREPLIAAGHSTRLAKEAVATAVSVVTICPYCADMHSIGMGELAEAGDADAILADRLADVTDPDLRELAGWARGAHLAGTAELPAAAAAARPELVGVLVAMHYLTRMVNVFLSNFLLPPGLSPAGRRRLKQGVGALLGPLLRRSSVPGRAVPLLPAAALRPDAAWALGNDTVAAGVARAYAALDAAGERSLPPGVRALVTDRLAGWTGEDTGLSRQWCEDLVAGLPPAERAPGRLALLTAFASYQVDGEVVDEFRRADPDDRRLVEAAAWASFAAARRIGARHVPH